MPSSARRSVSEQTTQTQLGEERPGSNPASRPAVPTSPTRTASAPSPRRDTTQFHAASIASRHGRRLLAIGTRAQPASYLVRCSFGPGRYTWLATPNTSAMHTSTPATTYHAPRRARRKRRRNRVGRGRSRQHGHATMPRDRAAPHRTAPAGIARRPRKADRLAQGIPPARPPPAIPGRPCRQRPSAKRSPAGARRRLAHRTGDLANAAAPQSSPCRIRFGFGELSFEARDRALAGHLDQAQRREVGTPWSWRGRATNCSVRNTAWRRCSGSSMSMKSMMMIPPRLRRRAPRHRLRGAVDN